MGVVIDTREVVGTVELVVVLDDRYPGHWAGTHPSPATSEMETDRKSHLITLCKGKGFNTEQQ